MRIQTLQPSVERPQPTQPRGTHTHTHTAGSATRFGGRYSAHLLPLIISPPSEENDTIRTTTVSARSQRVQTRSQVAKRAKIPTVQARRQRRGGGREFGRGDQQHRSRNCAAAAQDAVVVLVRVVVIVVYDEDDDDVDNERMMMMMMVLSATCSHSKPYNRTAWQIPPAGVNTTAAQPPLTTTNHVQG